MGDHDYDKLRELAEAATPGPYVVFICEDRASVMPAGRPGDVVPYGATPADAAYFAACSPAAILALLDRAERAERDRDEANAAHAAALAEVSDALGNIPHKTMASAIAYVRETVRERDDARAERDARPEITAEDADAAADSLGAEWDFVPYDTRQRINAALRTHAAKAKVTNG